MWTETSKTECGHLSFFFKSVTSLILGCVVDTLSLVSSPNQFELLVTTAVRTCDPLHE